METSALLVEGLQLMVLGMSTVFLFLGLLVIVMHAASRLVRLIDERRSPGTPGSGAVTDSAPVSGEIVAAIAIAVDRYRRTHKH